LLEGWGNQPTSALKRAEESFCSLFESKEDARTAMRYIAENSIMWKWLEDASSIPDEKQADLFDSEY
jgi:UTP:GlnB (protein PII) uridylyltransferase